MRDALEYAGFGALTFALTRTVVNAYGGLEEGVDGGICATLHTIIVKEDDVLAAVVGKIHHAGVKIAIPEGSSGKRGFLQLVGALWADAKSTDRLTPWLTELLTPLVAVAMRAKAEYYESATFDHEAKRAHKKEIYIEQDIKFFNSLQDMFHQGRSAPAQNVTAVVPVPAKIDDGVSMKSLEEALDADGGLLAVSSSLIPNPET
ncbi:hypothetical protein FB45DRAFT_379686 [Roridomyces roridus]|uniref:Uncharacterized protein n=1 Tax=Roridomyces roridus TaxID=1738132 RepID=A0AAD7B3L0_9AGAR|nr:hypothetical protein FB45DRAFT_379686 [Roridomyces roridus]